MTESLDREDVIKAVADGVRNGIVELGTSQHRFDVPHELLYDAIRQGVCDAIWKIATNATDMPCADFYDTIKDGIRDGMDRLRFEIPPEGT